MDSEVREKHQREKEKQKTYADEKRKAKVKNVKPGDQVMVQQKKSTIKTPWDPNPYTMTQVKGSQVQLKRGDEVKRRAVNLVKKIKWRKGEEKRETKIRDMEDPDIDISIEEIRKRIREEKEAAEEGARESQRLDESTDSDFTITYEEAPTSPNQDTEGEEVRAEDGEAGGGKAKRLSPRQ